MNPTESAILGFFDIYRAGPGQMVFFQPGACKLPVERFKAGMESLIERQLVVKERPKHAYSLTHRGYQHSLAKSLAATGNR
ncbi:MAG TPA: hypothetical protein VGY55_00795 [Pirellulales bacterium]|jgi:hypothetical protein|nr:hypothetical protein [Pirellulales bacterium]